jgi:alkylation response protein AidB-like acyl-CoA dehydrogenase
MDFNLTENQVLIAQTIRDFAEKNIKPFMMEWDETQHFPVETLKQLGELGLMGIVIPENYGGSGFGYFEYITALIELGKVDGALTLSVAAHNSLCTNHIYKFGNEEQRKKYLPKLTSGEWIGSWGLTEPNTGSDAGRMQCVAHQDGDYWILNGTKNFITHGISSNVTVVIARTGELLDSRGMTAFVVERGTPGFSGGKKENKLGMRCSETAEMIFDNCRIPKENVLGEVGDGFVQSLKILDGGRISIAALSLGIAVGAMKQHYNIQKKESNLENQFQLFKQ